MIRTSDKGTIKVTFLLVPVVRIMPFARVRIKSPTRKGDFLRAIMRLWPPRSSL